MVSRIQIARADITAHFERMPRVLRINEIAQAFNENKDFWRLAKNTSLASFIAFLREKGQLKEIRLPFPQRPVTGYTWGEVPILEVLVKLIENSFYSHYTAIRLHGLTEQVPKVIYLNHERTSNSRLGQETNSEPYEQEAIDSAYLKAPRVSTNEVVYGGYRVVLLSSAYQGMLGITQLKVNYGDDQDLQVQVTNLERTLIDIAVRPFYAGGVFEVAKAYENARDKASVNTVAAMLTKMQFGYPYHQAIGYYLERAAFKKSVVEIFRRLPMERDFYLTHDMGESTYVARWRLYVPKGM